MTAITDAALGIAELRRRIWTNGFRPVAVYNAALGDDKSGKRPHGDDWTGRARLDPPEATVSPVDPRHANTGILCDGLRVVDIDIDDPALAADVRMFVEIALGETIARTRPGSGRSALVYRAAEGKPAKRVLTGNRGKIEILGCGQQFVAFGEHYTGASLEWPEGGPGVRPRAVLPSVTETQIAEMLAALASTIGCEPTKAEPAPTTEPRSSGHGASADILDVTAALAVIPNDDGPADWEAWNRVMMAIWAATGGSGIGLSVALAWSSRHLDYDQEATDERWAHYSKSPPTSVGAGTLFYLAKQARPDWCKPSEIADRSQPGTEFDALPPEPGSAAAPGRIRMLSPSECAISDGRKYLIKGLIAERDLVCIFGPPGAGKSIIAPHLGYSVAQGRPAFGRRIRTGGVFYVAAEDQRGMRQRVTGLKLTHGVAQGFALVEGVGTLLDDIHADELRALVAEHRPALIIIDTVAMAWPGIDENTSHDMGLVVAAARSLTVHGAAVVLIHHDTKDGNGTPRGHSLLNGALDVSLQLGKADDNGIIRGKLVKNRNGACDGTVAFRIRSVTVGQDEDGDDITAPVCDELSESAAPVEKLPRAATAALTILREMIAANGGKFVLESDWREACDDRRISTADDKDGRGKAFRRAYALLIERNAIESRGGVVSLPRGACQDFTPVEPDISDISDIVRVCPPGKTDGTTGHFGHGSIDMSECPSAGMPQTNEDSGGQP